ncbi:tRNA (adenosine(37)-N6)-threonylcarbamoyltransferase complex dimerization subunit type 1 TsaB [Muricauda sp. SCSIO 64092]|uniref:tRNA (adenosine(37)-N6)-threonylcarbamoyltransferase complex dimerization subunit type 1 TsaB n=1 Tax=Allomuricauda sp. SCSIO 64092 TaxID=2908842 RepID=UPI001FF4C57D|nr:tRNA (adenosine(37)-N6)-threonylcarbamoyltransferase complex dimerization subunit type 1 TsaB [Muricauda sp. SCSIO 64092]UOY07826.1 tRNA (adenosine(37)-N6)-threonylcarbamoyltransferase complex dimerization subunit type 1 TsaB [Muricauda sp. SCSIO 64092]
MAKILCLETATTNCSVALGVNGEVVGLVEENSPNYSHSEQLHIFVEQVLIEASLSFSDLDAVAVSKGPGSYTGLRIGVSSAKGLCFSLDLPLIATPTLLGMAHQLKVETGEVIVPLIDARRMEVYAAVFDAAHTEIRETRAEIINEGSFSDYMMAPRVHLIGNGAEKCRGVLSHDNIHIDGSIVPSAKEMVTIATKKYETKDFEDMAYFEPYYLKDFVLQSRKKA